MDSFLLRLVFTGLVAFAPNKVPTPDATEMRVFLLNGLSVTPPHVSYLEFKCNDVAIEGYPSCQELSLDPEKVDSRRRIALTAGYKIVIRPVVGSFPRNALSFIVCPGHSKCKPPTYDFTHVVDIKQTQTDTTKAPIRKALLAADLHEDEVLNVIGFLDLTHGEVYTHAEYQPDSWELSTAKGQIYAVEPASEVKVDMEIFAPAVAIDFFQYGDVTTPAFSVLLRPYPPHADVDVTFRNEPELLVTCSDAKLPKSNSFDHFDHFYEALTTLSHKPLPTYKNYKDDTAKKCADIWANMKKDGGGGRPPVICMMPQFTQD